MSRKSKRLTDFEKNVDLQETRSLADAIELLKECPGTKCDQSVDVALQLGVDPRKSDQHVRGTVTLPHGTGKTIRIVAIAKGDKVQEALDAGADEAGHEELIEKISNGWTDFDALVVTPDMMREVGKLGKVLGPRGLMPTPKAGTVTTDLPKATRRHSHRRRRGRPREHFPKSKTHGNFPDYAASRRPFRSGCR